MIIVMNEAGAVVARYEDGQEITPAMHGGDVLVGYIEKSRWTQDTQGNDKVSGSAVDVARDLAAQMVQARADRDMADSYSNAERARHGRLLSEAEAFRADGNEGIYLKAEAEARGWKPRTLADRVIRKAEADAERVAKAKARRADTESAIEKAKTIRAIIDAVM